ncbi:MAG TPA: polymer-forming cytoskeletal protein [Longimicrobiales bacterium]
MFNKKSPPSIIGTAMKENQAAQSSREGVISIIGPGMRVVGDCVTEGTLRVEGTIEGTVEAGKAVVVGKDGVVLGDIATQDAVIGGRVVGTIVAESRLELQATCVIEGEVRARRIKLDEGGRVNGNIQTGDMAAGKAEPAPKRAPAPAPASAADSPEKAVAAKS